MLKLSIPKMIEDAKAGLKVRGEQQPDSGDSTSQFFDFVIGNGEHQYVVHLESTATSVMDEILRLPMAVQKGVIDSFAQIISTPGKQAQLEGDKKGRGARIICLVSDDGQRIRNLLITH